MLAERYRHICRSVPMDYLDEAQAEYDITLRIVRFEIMPGIFENIITNLPEREFDFDDFKELYHLRWNGENSFRDLKHPICLKAFHSKKYEYQVNFAEAFKTCRDFLRIHDGKTEMDMDGLIAQNIEAIRPGRTFARQHRFKLPISFCYRN
ncbi:hypothetical protein NE476_08635 [Enterocloster bolteae]|nr:transposase [Enterocloster bolteae]MCQ5142421.1 hypothetical protein [Enterocloster bolteae]